MDIVIAVILLALFVAWPLKSKSNMLLVLGMLCFGWVLQQTTSQDVLLIARSTAVGIDRSTVETASLLTVALLPGLLTAYITKKKAGKTQIRMIGAGLAPAIFLVAWRLVSLSLAGDTRKAVLESPVQEALSIYENYILWSACILILLYLFMSRYKKPIDIKKSHKT